MAARAYWKGYLKLSLVTLPSVVVPRNEPGGQDALPPDQSEDRQSVKAADGR